MNFFFYFVFVFFRVDSRVGNVIIVKIFVVIIMMYLMIIKSNLYFDDEFEIVFLMCLCVVLSFFRENARRVVA